jgi:tetratricopeptide (TPR) repeat protein
MRANSLLRRSLLGAALALALLPSLARADDCPEPTEVTGDRRALARDWFSRAEAAETAKDNAAAARAYTCSFALVPHPSTAYNLARAAERAGDLKLALTAHREYLSLLPDAPDRKEVEARIASLRGRLAAASAPARPPAPSAPSPAPAAELTAIAPAPGPSFLSRVGTPEWIIAGVAAAALVSGVVFNIGARTSIADCRDMAHNNQIAPAKQACDRADLFAYTSYALLGTAGAAALVDAGLIWRRERQRESVALQIVPGGLTLALRGRF